MPEIQASFLYPVPFFLCPLRRRGTHSGERFGLFLGVCLSPTPSRQPLFETSLSGVAFSLGLFRVSRFVGIANRHIVGHLGVISTFVVQNLVKRRTSQEPQNPEFIKIGEK